MSMINDAKTFFEACDTGKGWASCAQFCQQDATFSGQSEVLAEIHSLEAYADWMKGLLVPLPDGRYELKGFAADTERDRAGLRCLPRHSHRRWRPDRTYGQERFRRLRIRHGVCRWKNRTYDQDLE